MQNTPRPHKDATWLAFDTSVIGASVALWHKGQIFYRDDPAPGRQASQLVPMIEAMLDEAGVWYDDVQRLITTIGPGSFTGIRIGLAAAQGIVSAKEMDVSVMTTLDTLALKSAEIHGDGEVWAALNGGKGEVFCQLFHVKQFQIAAKQGILLLRPDALASHISKNQRIVGNAEAMLPDALKPQYHTGASLPDARVMLQPDLEAQRIDALVPLYIRAPDAKLPANA